MRSSYWFYALAVLSLIFGLGFFLAPDAMTGAYSGGAINDVSRALARYYGVAELIVAGVAWAAGAQGPSALRTWIARFTAVGAVLYLIVHYLTQAAGVISGSGAILNYAISLVVLVVFAYYGFVRPETSP